MSRTTAFMCGSTKDNETESITVFGNRPPLNLSVTWVGELCVSCVTSAS